MSLPSLLFVFSRLYEVNPDLLSLVLDFLPSDESPSATDAAELATNEHQHATEEMCEDEMYDNDDNNIINNNDSGNNNNSLYF